MAESDEDGGPEAAQSIHLPLGPAGMRAGRGGARHATTWMGVVPRAACRRSGGGPAAGGRRALPSPLRLARHRRLPAPRRAARRGGGPGRDPTRQSQVARPGEHGAAAGHGAGPLLNDGNRDRRPNPSSPGRTRHGSAGRRLPGASKWSDLRRWPRKHCRLANVSIPVAAVGALQAAIRTAPLHLVPVRPEEQRLRPARDDAMRDRMCDAIRSDGRSSARCRPNGRTGTDEPAGRGRSSGLPGQGCTDQLREDWRRVGIRAWSGADGQSDDAGQAFHLAAEVAATVGTGFRSCAR